MLDKALEAHKQNLKVVKRNSLFEAEIRIVIYLLLLHSYVLVWTFNDYVNKK